MGKRQPKRFLSVVFAVGIISENLAGCHRRCPPSSLAVKFSIVGWLSANAPCCRVDGPLGPVETGGVEPGMPEDPFWCQIKALYLYL